MATTLPANVHISKHPCLRAKLSQLRSKSTNARETKTLVNEIATIIAVEALAGLEVLPSGTVSLFFSRPPVNVRRRVLIVMSGQDTSPIGYDYPTEILSPASITLVPIMRSGLGMLKGEQKQLEHQESLSLTHKLSTPNYPSSSCVCSSSRPVS
jgi:uracil phosphoribosyltransferase